MRQERFGKDAFIVIKERRAVDEDEENLCETALEKARLAEIGYKLLFLIRECLRESTFRAHPRDEPSNSKRGMKMSGTEIYPKQTEQILTQQAKETLILLNLESGTYYALEEIGGRVWELCDGNRTISEIVSVVCEEYDAPSQMVETDVRELIGELINEKLLVEDNQASRHC